MVSGAKELHAYVLVSMSLIYPTTANFYSVRAGSSMSNTMVESWVGLRTSSSLQRVSHTTEDCAPYGKYKGMTWLHSVRPLRCGQAPHLRHNSTNKATGEVQLLRETAYR